MRGECFLRWFCLNQHDSLKCLIVLGAGEEPPTEAFTVCGQTADHGKLAGTKPYREPQIFEQATPSTDLDAPIQRPAHVGIGNPVATRFAMLNFRRDDQIDATVRCDPREDSQHGDGVGIRLRVVARCPVRFLGPGGVNAAAVNLRRLTGLQLHVLAVHLSQFFFTEKLLEDRRNLTAEHGDAKSALFELQSQDQVELFFVGRRPQVSIQLEIAKWPFQVYYVHVQPVGSSRDRPGLQPLGQCTGRGGVFLRQAARLKHEEQGECETAYGGRQL